MPYATVRDLTDTYGADLIAQLARTTGEGRVLDETIEEALEAASAIIDAHLALRQIEVTLPTDAMRAIAIDIAWYRLAYNRLKQTEEMRKRYEDAIRLLERYADATEAVGYVPPDGNGEDVPGQIHTTWLERA